MYEVTEEQASVGIMFAAGTQDAAYFFALSAAAVPTPYTLEQMQAELVTKYTDAQLVEVNGVGLVAYTQPANNLLMCMALDPTGTVVYTFTFKPADDADFAALAAVIASTIRNIEQ